MNKSYLALATILAAAALLYNLAPEQTQPASHAKYLAYLK